MDLLHRIERHLKETGTPPTRFGRDAAGDPRLVFDLRLGREVGRILHARIVAHIAHSKRSS